MSKLSELKSSPDVGLAEYPADVCVSAKLAAELEAADKTLFDCEQIVTDLQAELKEAQSVDSDAPKRPRRSGESANADLKRRLAEAEEAAAEAAKVSDAVLERMKNHTVQLTIRARQAGEWSRWALAHPARTEWVRTGGTEEEPEGEERVIERDRRYAGGSCNIDALVDELHQWITKYDGEDPSDEWWELVSSAGAPPHLLNAASVVVRTQVQGVSPGKARLTWLAERRSANNSK